MKYSLSPFAAVKVPSPDGRTIIGLFGSGVNKTLPVLVNRPRSVALPEPIISAPIGLPEPSRIKVTTPFPLAANGRSVAVTAILPASKARVAISNFVLRKRFICSSPFVTTKCFASDLEWCEFTKHHRRSRTEESSKGWSSEGHKKG